MFDIVLAFAAVEKLGLEKVTNCSFFLTKVSNEVLVVAMQNCGDVRVD